MTVADDRKVSTIGAFQLFNLAFGVVIGIGWIMVMGSWLGSAGPFGAIIAFAIAGAAMLTIAYSYAAVALESPVSGGEFVYATRAFGLRIGAWVGWFLALAYVVVIAFEIVSFAWIFRELFPSILPALAANSKIDFVGLGMGIAALLGVIIFNLRGARAATRLQDGLVIAKVILSLLLVGAGLLFGDVQNLYPLWGAHESGSPARGILTVLAMAPFFYAGFGVVSQALGDVRTPETINLLPRLMAMIIMGTCLFYVLIILASATSAPRALTLDSSMPAAAAFGYISPVFGKIVLLLGVFGLLTMLNGLYFAAVRLIQALAQNQLLPERLGRIDSQTGISTSTGLFVAIAAVILAACGKEMLSPFLNIASAVLSAVMAVVCAVLVRYRLQAGNNKSIAVSLIGAALAIVMIVITMTGAVTASNSLVAPEWFVIAGWVALGLALGLARNRKAITA